MGWAIGTGENGRDIGYGVPANCDYPLCGAEIDRGVSYACGSFRSDNGCGLYFCPEHLYFFTDEYDDICAFCDACVIGLKLNAIDENEGWQLKPEGYKPKPDILKWVVWKLNHESWQQWRDENPTKVVAMKKRVVEADPNVIKELLEYLKVEEGLES